LCKTELFQALRFPAFELRGFDLSALSSVLLHCPHCDVFSQLAVSVLMALVLALRDLVDTPES
jgi:hypothetical protein